MAVSPDEELKIPIDKANDPDGVGKRNVSVNLGGKPGKTVKLKLFFAGKWILISEVQFEKRKFDPNSSPFSRDLGLSSDQHEKSTGGNRTHDC